MIINNAGIMPIGMMSEVRVDEWDAMIDVNIKGLLYGVAAVLPSMKERGQGHIVNMASIAGQKVLPGFSVYCATKHAVRAISEGLRQENPDLRITMISPGLVDTELPQSIQNEEMKASLIEAAEKHAISPDAIANAIVYALEQPSNVEIDEVTIRPTTQEP